MIDRDKTIRGLKEIADYFNECRGNASFGSKAEEHFWELQSAARDAVELLMKQEPVKPRIESKKISIMFEGDCVMSTAYCGNCNALIEAPSDNGTHGWYYCPNCGMAVKWDG